MHIQKVRRHITYDTPRRAKSILTTSWKPVFKTGLQDVYEDLKTLTDPSFWRRIFKVLKTSVQDVLHPKFNALSRQAFKSSSTLLQYGLQNVVIMVKRLVVTRLHRCRLKHFADQSWRRVRRPKYVDRPVVLKTYFQSPRDQFSRPPKAQAWRPFQDG